MTRLGAFRFHLLPWEPKGFRLRPLPSHWQYLGGSPLRGQSTPLGVPGHFGSPAHAASTRALTLPTVCSGLDAAHSLSKSINKRFLNLCLAQPGGKETSSWGTWHSEVQRQEPSRKSCAKAGGGPLAPRVGSRASGDQTGAVEGSERLPTEGLLSVPRTTQLAPPPASVLAVPSTWAALVQSLVWPASSQDSAQMSPLPRSLS